MFFFPLDILYKKFWEINIKFSILLPLKLTSKVTVKHGQTAFKKEGKKKKNAQVAKRELKIWTVKGVWKNLIKKHCVLKNVGR